MKYRLSRRDFPRAEPEGFPEGSADFSSFTRLKSQYSHSQLPLLVNIFFVFGPPLERKPDIFPYWAS